MALQLVMGDGRVVFGPETFRLTERVTTEFSVDQEGFLREEKITTQRYSVAETTNFVGQALYSYNDGRIGKNSFEKFEVVEVKTIAYGPLSDDTHQVFETVDASGSKVIVVEEVEGFLPAAELREDCVATDDMFDVLPDPTLQLVASALNSDTIECEVISEPLEEQRDINDVELRAEWVEGDEQCEAFGWYEISEGSAIPYKFTLPFNALIRAGQRWDVDLGEGDVLDRFRVTHVKHAHDPTGEMLTEVSGLHYIEGVTP